MADDVDAGPEPTIRVPVDRSATGSSFERALRNLLLRRCRVLFVIGVCVSAVAFLVWEAVGGHDATASALADESWVPFLRLGHLASFLAGLAYVQLAEPDRRRLQAAAAVVVALNLVMAVAESSLLHPMTDPFFAMALLLFVHAAFIPGRTTQAWLAGLATVVAPLAWMLSHSLVPEAAAFWEGRGGPAAFRAHLVWIGVGSGVLSVVSVVVGRTLYSLQRTAHRARRLGNYLVEQELGSGGMGEVYRARHAMIRRPTAVKVLRGEVLGTETARARFEREVQLSATLTHPNTITIFDYGRTEEDVFYYAMEYLNGLDLQRLVERFGPLPPERAVHLLLQVCGSLSEAHDRGVVHRDVKPANIFLTERGGICDFVKVLDFGLARSVVEGPDGGRDLTETGMVFGTPRYIAPESVYGSDRADARSDLYNLGAVAYWALVGRPLFEGSSGAALFVDHVNTDPPAPSEVSELEVPPALDRVVLTCLAKDPADRYASAAELAGALRGVPLDREWTAERAREWWSLHLPEEMRPLEPGSDGGSGERRGAALLPGWPRPE